jgi:hypothetical protein
MAVLYRGAGIVVGAALVMSLEGTDQARYRYLLARLVPLVVLSYIFAIVLVNDLVSPHWRTVPEALAALDPFGLLPFYHHYIVPKAHAAASVAMHLLMFAPIGVMVALRAAAGAPRPGAPLF